MSRQHTLTDSDGDRAQLWSPAGGRIFVTVDGEDKAVTAGSFTRAQLVEALDAVAPAGDSTDHETTGEALARLQATLTRLLHEADAELRDEADGGVAAALIEKDAEARPLTPDAITDEMVERAAHYMAMKGMPVTYSLDPAGTAANFHGRARAVLHAALTEPPARPEGAEDWEDWLIEAMPHESMPDEDIALLADRIAQRLNEERS